MNRTHFEKLRADLHKRVDDAIDAAIAALHLPRRHVLPPVETEPVDEVSRAQARSLLQRYGVRGDE